MYPRAKSQWMLCDVTLGLRAWRKGSWKAKCSFLRGVAFPHAWLVLILPTASLGELTLSHSSPHLSGEGDHTPVPPRAE